jgi:ribosomal protein S12 methylthiotransferase accessory factor
MKIPVHFPGGLCVSAKLGRHVVTTDQPEQSGGGDSAPAPFELFLASLATCAGIYALRFCQAREIPTQGLAIELETVEAERRKITGIRITVRPPEGFPDRYRAALERAVDQCAVKRHLIDPPRFEITLLEPAPVPRRPDIPSERSLEPLETEVEIASRRE